MTGLFSFFRQRLPFFGLLLAGGGGILAADFAGWPSLVFFATSLFFLAGTFLRVGGPWIFLSVACAFACVHIWQTRESPSHRLAELVGTQRLLASATGTVCSDPTPYGTSRDRFLLQIDHLDMGGYSWNPSAAVAVVVPSPAPARGDRVRVTGSLRQIEPPRNPGEFDAKAWMARCGVWCSLEVGATTDVEILDAVSACSIFSIAKRCLRWMEGTLRLGIADDPIVCDLLVGMVLGVTSSIPDVLLEEFRGTGTYHIFSVSGLHVGMIGLILWQALRMAGVGRRWTVAIIIPALFFYALLTGWKPSSLRAAVMSAIFLIGMTSSRRPVPFNSLCAAAFLILVQWTNELFNPGFQLSFLVVAAILLFAAPLHELIRRRWLPDSFVPRQIWTTWQKHSAVAVEKLGGLAAVSMAAWAGSLPLTLYYFHMVSFSALPANMVIVPLAFVIMVTAVFALAGGVFWTTLAAIFNNANWVFCHLLLGVVHVMSCLPGSFVYLGAPAPAPLTVTVFDLGAGGSAGIRFDGNLWLLDCGSKRQCNSVLQPWLRSCGKAGPDGLLLTHGDARHIGGAMALVESNPPGILVDSVLDDRSPQRGLLHKRLQELHIPKSLARAGDTFRISRSAALKVLYPPAGIARNTADDKALVVRLDSGKTRMLFLSDAGPSTIDWLLKNAASELPADILIKGAHRSGLPVDTAFIDAVRPRMVVCTAAHFPASEQLDASWVSLVESRGIRIFRQDLSGAVTIQVRPSHFQASGFFDGSTFSSAVD